MGSGEIPIELGDSWFSEIALGLASSDDYWKSTVWTRPSGLPNSDKLRMPINLTWESEHG